DGGLQVMEKGDSIVFLRKIVKGGADKSYGIQVARLAGLPEAVLVRAQDLVSQLSDADITDTIRKEAGTKKKAKKAIHYDDVDLMQMSLFDTTTDESVLGELEALDIGNLTPVEALNILYRLQNKLKNRWRVGPDA
ncbi:MAG: DNA mismatch repair protein MutS, partial [Lachnospiraceae bacterium]|nr:DNA mismatch repair protein MutS [Lachnospiraceae bacterium]